MRHRAAALACLLGALASCGDPPERGADSRATAGAPGSGVTPAPADTGPGSAAAIQRAADSIAARAAQMPGMRFDPATIKEGDVIGDFRVGRVDITDAGGDIGHVGTVRFLGETTISGEKRPHHDFPEVTTVCMDVDSASTAKLPRWSNDTRTVSWLCFENQEDAIRMLGPSTRDREPITIVVDVYQTPRQFSDVYNTARLVRVVTRGPVRPPTP